LDEERRGRSAAGDGVGYSYRTGSVIAWPLRRKGRQNRPPATPGKLAASWLELAAGLEVAR
jgi:hypothetical protein